MLTFESIIKNTNNVAYTVHTLVKIIWATFGKINCFENLIRIRRSRKNHKQIFKKFVLSAVPSNSGFVGDAVLPVTVLVVEVPQIKIVRHKGHY